MIRILALSQFIMMICFSVYAQTYVSLPACSKILVNLLETDVDGQKIDFKKIKFNRVPNHYDRSEIFFSFINDLFSYHNFSNSTQLNNYLSKIESLSVSELGSAIQGTYVSNFMEINAKITELKKVFDSLLSKRLKIKEKSYLGPKGKAELLLCDMQILSRRKELLGLYTNARLYYDEFYAQEYVEEILAELIEYSKGQK